MRKGLGKITIVHAQRSTQSDCIFHRHTRALGEVLQHRMRGIAQ